MNQSTESPNITANILNTNEYSQKELRQLYRNKRSALTSKQQATGAQAALTQAIKHKLFLNCERVAIYLTNEGELDTRPLIEYLWENGINVYLPVLHPFSKGYLLFLNYNTFTPMKKNVYGILEPALDITKLCPIEQLDMIITPLVAFDDKGNRMGMGGGFYDRTLKNVGQSNNLANKNAKQIKLVGLAHDEQQTEQLPTQVWDIPLPQILTPTTLYSF